MKHLTYSLSYANNGVGQAGDAPYGLPGEHSGIAQSATTAIFVGIAHSKTYIIPHSIGDTEKTATLINRPGLPSSITLLNESTEMLERRGLFNSLKLRH